MCMVQGDEISSSIEVKESGTCYCIYRGELCALGDFIIPYNILLIPVKRQVLNHTQLII